MASDSGEKGEAPKRVLILRDFSVTAMNPTLEYLQEDGVGDWEVEVPGYGTELTRGRIFRDFVAPAIDSAHKILALTERANANVAFEVGYALGRSKPTILCSCELDGPSWSEQEPPFQGWGIERVAEPELLEETIRSGKGYTSGETPQEGTDTLFLCPSTGQGKIYHRLKEQVCPEWRCPKPTGWNLSNLPGQLAGISRVVWMIIPPPNGVGERDGPANTAMAAIAGYAEAHSIELVVLRSNDARHVADVADEAILLHNNGEFKAELRELAGTAEETEPADTLTLYRRHLVRRHSDLVPFFGQGGRRLDQVFVQLQIQYDRGDAEQRFLRKGGRGELSLLPQRCTLEELMRLEPEAELAEDERLVTRRWAVLGGPGSGKSTICRQLCWTLGQVEDDALPLLVNLNRFARRKPAVDPFDFVEEELRGVDGSPGQGLARRLRSEAESTDRVWILFDGLDEVEKKDRADLRERLRELSERYERCTILVTSRPEGFQSPGALFREAELQPLPEASQRELLTRWIGARGAGELFPRITDHPRLAEIAETPLMLTLLAKLERERLEQAPEDRRELPHASVELYDQAIDLLLRRGHGAEPKQVNDTTAAREILHALSLHLQHDDVESWDFRQELYPALLEVLDEHPDLDKMVGRSWNNPENFLEDVGRNSGILAECDGPGTPWRYMHRSLREYLAAEALLRPAIERPAIGLELLTGDPSRWGQTFVLLCSLLRNSPEAQQMLLEALVTSKREVALRTLPELEGLPPKRSVELLKKIERWDGDDLAELTVGLLRGNYPAETIRDAVLEDVSEEMEIQDLAYRYYALEEAGIAIDREELFRRCGRPVEESVELDWCRVPPDGDGVTVLMGSAEGEEGRFAWEGPQHEVEVPEFELARTPVTEAQYAQFHSRRGRDENPCPVAEVRWWEAWLFSRWIGGTLPTESQWECACRAGATTRFWSGDAEQDLERVGWYNENSKGRAHSVGEKPPNEYGLRDMHGNVWEWCMDRWSGRYEDSSQVHPAAYGRKQTGDRDRVFRGGGFLTESRIARSACRGHARPEYCYRTLGFRPAREIAEDTVPSA